MPRGVPRNRAAATSNRIPAALASETVAPAPVAEPERAEPEAAPQTTSATTPVLTDEQLLIKELRNQLAVERGKKDASGELDPVASPGSADNILIHFVEDGFCALGQIWYRGQEIEFEIGSQAYKDTFDRLGNSWLDLRDDDFAQLDKWGHVMFRPGPWRGAALSRAKVSFEVVKDEAGRPVRSPDEEELARAEQAEARRKRAAPRLESVV